MYRIRIFNQFGSLCVGGFATYEEAALQQDAMNRAYASQPHLDCTTVIEDYLPLRPLRDQLCDLRRILAQRVGETDPILRIIQGLPAEEPILKAYDALGEALRALSALVYEAEGKF